MKLLETIQSEVYIIAELSANHAGKLENALELIHIAKEIGADCVKIQTYTADTITIDCKQDCFYINGGLWDGYYLYDLYKDAYTPWEWQAQLKAEADQLGIDFLSTPFDKTAVDFLEMIGLDFYKIASFELVDIPLIKYTASKGKPLIMSCGMATVEEIDEAVEAAKSVGNENIVLLKCCSEYPTNYENMNLNVITDMKHRYNLPVGLSDHSFGSLAPVIAVGLGACVIEKHICLDRNIDSPDVGFSMIPDEFAAMINDVRNAVRIKGNVSYGLTPSEAQSKLHRRSLFAVKDIAAGEVITENNIRSIRPADGLHTRHFYDLLGKKAKVAISRGTPLKMEYFE